MTVAQTRMEDTAAIMMGERTLFQTFVSVEKEANKEEEDDAVQSIVKNPSPREPSSSSSYPLGGWRRILEKEKERSRF